jgi:uncharacterized protein YndB with AHSA1/START domain
MPRATAARELPASRADVWQFLSVPVNFSEWWPGVAAIEADRQGFAEGARWTIRPENTTGVFRRSGYGGTLFVRTIEAPRRFAWTMTGDRIDVELLLEESSPERTRAFLEISAAWLVSIPRSLPRRALERLQTRCRSASAG